MKGFFQRKIEKNPTAAGTGWPGYTSPKEVIYDNISFFFGFFNPARQKYELKQRLKS